LFIQASTQGFIATSFVAPEDFPVPGDYDGVGHAELAVYRPSTSEWLITGPSGVEYHLYGAANLDRPVPANYDGDGKTGPFRGAIRRPAPSCNQSFAQGSLFVLWRFLARGGICLFDRRSVAS
jgi:hypothetical protein